MIVTLIRLTTYDSDANSALSYWLDVLNGHKITSHIVTNKITTLRVAELVSELV